jgi:hypothetical protein
MPLYTVTMTRTEIICRYDDRGRRLSETKRDIPQIYGDLPWSTALGYQRQFPLNNVVITAQDDSFTKPEIVLVKEPTYYRPRAPKPVAIEKPSAAATGDLSAALSR